MGDIGFGELVGRMVWGTEQPDSIRGVVRTVDDEGETLRRVARHGFLVREESMDGRLRHIVGPSAQWFWDDEHDLMRVRHHGTTPEARFGHAPIGGLSVGGHRPSWERWEGSDFTQPSSPVQRTSMLGRECYTVELAPPSHKPHPLRITVDCLTGLVLREQNAGFGHVTEWTSATIGEEVPAATFEWTGPAEPLPSHTDHQAQWQAEREQGREWLERRGFLTLAVPTSTEFSLHEYDSHTGSIYAGVEARFAGILLRRPTSTGSWDEPATVNYPHDYRWSDKRWDWYLASDTAVEPPDLEHIKASLRRTT